VSLVSRILEYDVYWFSHRRSGTRHGPELSTGMNRRQIGYRPGRVHTQTQCRPIVPAVLFPISSRVSAI